MNHTQPIAVDARFAGGAILVEQDAGYLGDGRSIITLALPGLVVPLFPHEARALAAALTSQANAASGARTAREMALDASFRVVVEDVE